MMDVEVQVQLAGNLEIISSWYFQGWNFEGFQFKTW